MNTFIYKGIRYCYEEVDGVKKLRKIQLFENFGFEVDGDVAVEAITKPNDNNEIDTVDEIKNFLHGYPENTTLKEVLDEIEAGGASEEDIANTVDNLITETDAQIDDDLEDVFFPPKVNGIAAEDSGENVTLRLVGENIADDRPVAWSLRLGDIRVETSGVGTTLTLDSTRSTQYRNASQVTGKVVIGDYTSAQIRIK